MDAALQDFEVSAVRAWHVKVGNSSSLRESCRTEFSGITRCVERGALPASENQQSQGFALGPGDPSLSIRR
jgi:hypothetical protein